MKDGAKIVWDDVNKPKGLLLEVNKRINERKHRDGFLVDEKRYEELKKLLKEKLPKIEK